MIFCGSQLDTRQKIMIGSLIGLILLGGLAALIWRYFEAYSDMSQVVNKNPIQQPAVNLAQINEVYQNKSTKVMADFFVAVGSADSNIGAVALQAQTDLLALTVPGDFRKRHLAEVLLLGEIVKAAESKNAAEVQSKISELRQVAAQ